MPPSPIEFLASVGTLRALVLFALAASAWRAVHLHLQNDYRSPMPWAFLVVVLVVTLAMLSLST